MNKSIWKFSALALTLLCTGCFKENPWESETEADTSSETGTATTSDTDTFGPDTVTATTTDTATSESSITTDTGTNAGTVPDTATTVDTGSDTDATTATETVEETGSDTSHADTDTATHVDTSDTGSETSTTEPSDTDTCISGIEESRICTEDGKIQILDNCGDEISVSECTTPNSECIDGACECEAGWTGESCEICVVFVDNSLNDYTGNTGRSWNDALKTVQGGLDYAAQIGCEVWVAAGVYFPTQAYNASDERARAITLLENVALYGGFNGTEKNREERDFNNFVTILSGDIGVTGDDTDNAYHVVLGADNATIDGFTITAGRADSTTDGFGGGMDNDGVSPTVSNCIFTENYASVGGGMSNNNDAVPTLTECLFESNTAISMGGGMNNDGEAAPSITNCRFNSNEAPVGGGIQNSYGAAPLLFNCIFTNNTADNGGGMYNTYSSSPIISSCTFESNSAIFGGGGISNTYGARPVVTNSTFTSNTAEIGGGFRSWGSSPSVVNSTFIENTAVHGGGIHVSSNITVANSIFYKNAANESGGGIYLQGSTPIVANCTFVQNTAYQANGGGLFSANSVATISNSIIWSNTASTSEGRQISQGETDTNTPLVSYCNIDGGFPGTGNIDENPRFVNLSDANFELSSDSPCIDKGDVTLLPPDTNDMNENGNTGENIPFDKNGNTREVGTQVDMGAYEYQ